MRVETTKDLKIYGLDFTYPKGSRVEAFKVNSKYAYLPAPYGCTFRVDRKNVKLVRNRKYKKS